MKRILFFIVIPAAVIAALSSRSKRAEAPEEAAAGTAGEPAPPVSDPLGVKSAIEAVRRHADEALQAAHEAQSETEGELRAQFEARRRARK